ncbi:hypothetical protein R70723_20235 [Paenibacillus sp. FSL R7-0273]|uniref:hypothetical protein n=1 Tax=Paenibacillus sp. FSL R7-0273 TaxID=1536772 RepID=UPI0004F7AC77|nr:hypothetical protein [Paenibacillus sp. FSL R7-0273]AIQ47975.1 hypothetical protein R70723_20235 [Paenibacillus sp. FSL R7-0273]OMF94476.1 hypothetical protein BK144_08060 [Paenibacillus sp. FSL R7-0273]
MISKSKAFGILAIILLLYLFWNSLRSSTFELAKVTAIDDKQIQIVNLSGQIRTLKTSVDLSGLVEVNHEYLIDFDKRIGVKPQLQSIKVFE